ncbi:hypothetical protein, partial [Saccharicrinis fermentans]|uniref:hypothetical protein n=1 Tax=Saccharicrinis fermentans TaxID=982 RepID=UPI001F39146E
FDKKASKTRLSIFLKPRSLLIVNDCFKNENNAVFGVFLQRLFKVCFEKCKIAYIIVEIYY